MKKMKRLFDKEYRKYIKIRNKHRKALKKMASEDCDFDFGYIHDLVVAKILNMHEYYSLGYNVWQCDESRLKIVEQLNHVIDLQIELQSVYSDEGKYAQYNAADRMAREEELYKEIYCYIGENILNWWD